MRALGWLLVGLVAPALAGAGELRGRLELAIADVEIASAGPIAVYLEPLDAAAAVPKPSARAPKVLQAGARFSPDFLVVSAGQTVEMPNDDSIFHNVFSYSTPNDFDLGLYGNGESREVRLRYPGPVRIYCSIHESMNGTIFVSPTPWFAVARPSGRFELAGVPAGDYRLRTWSRVLPPVSQRVRVGEHAGAELVVRIGAR